MRGFVEERMVRFLGAISGLAVVVAVAATGLRAEEDFAIAGTYTENQVCKDDGSGSNVSRVKISSKEIESSVFGLCTIRDRKREGNKFSVHVECKGPGGAVMLGEVSFTIRDSNTLEFADQDNTYKAVLYKCPG
jgi:hypothetical protein